MYVIRSGDREFHPATLPGCISASNANVVESAHLANASVDFMQVIGGGGIPVHPGRREQMVTVVDGRGSFFVSNRWLELGSGDVAVWAAGEDRSWKTEAGLTLLSLRALGITRPVVL